jgi:cytochrome c556
MRILAAAAVALTVAGTSVGTAWAADPDVIISYRKGLMEAIGAHAQALGNISQGKLPYDKTFLAHARMLAAAATLAPQAFEENTHGQGKEKTTAKEAVWTDWAKFERGLQDMRDRAKEVASVAASGGAAAAGPALGELFKTCKSCHDDFRTK